MPVSNSLLTFLRVMLEGPTCIQNLSDKEIKSARIRVICTVSQLLISNAATSTQNLYQRHDGERPVPVYMGLKLHVHDHLKQII